MKLPSKKIEGGKYRYEIAPGKWVSSQRVSQLRKLGKIPKWGIHKLKERMA